MNQERVYTVSELNRSAKDALEGTFGEIWVTGEVSELKRAASGHIYFTLKDADSELSAVRFRGRTSAFAAHFIEQGTVVLAFGKLTVYEPRGRYQFVASILQPVGAGALQAAIERLKARLHEEGLFDPSHRKPLPRFPRRIGVITSATGAAFRDVRSVLERRWPLAHLLLFPSSVQGENAPAELVASLDAAIRYSASGGDLDLLIIGRGGGSAEDLAAFSDETLVRAISACPIPVVSAVGHEIDAALSDFVADLRAPTPASAAELAAPDIGELATTLDRLVARGTRVLSLKLAARWEQLRANLRESLFRLPERRVETLWQRLDVAVDRLARATSQTVSDRTRRLEHATDLLRLSDPGLPLRRGYSLTTLLGSTEPIRDAAELVEGTRIETRLAKGRLHSSVEEVIGE